MTVLDATLEVEIANEDFGRGADRFKEFGVPRRSVGAEAIAKQIPLPIRASEQTQPSKRHEINAHYRAYLDRLLQVSPSKRLAVLASVIGEAVQDDEAAIQALRRESSEGERSLYALREEIRLLAKLGRTQELLSVLAQEEALLVDIDEKAGVHTWMSALALEMLHQPEVCLAHADMAMTAWPDQPLPLLLRWRGSQALNRLDEQIRTAQVVAASPLHAWPISLRGSVKVSAATLLESAEVWDDALTAFQAGCDALQSEPTLRGGPIHRLALLGCIRLLRRAHGAGSSDARPSVDAPRVQNLMSELLSAHGESSAATRRVIGRTIHGSRVESVLAETTQAWVRAAQAGEWDSFSHQVSQYSARADIESVDRAQVFLFKTYGRREGIAFSIEAAGYEPKIQAAAHALVRVKPGEQGQHDRAKNEAVRDASHRLVEEEAALVSMVDEADHLAHMLLLDCLAEQCSLGKTLDFMDTWMRRHAPMWTPDLWLMSEELYARSGDAEGAARVVQDAVDMYDSDVYLLQQHSAYLGSRNREEQARVWLRLARLWGGALGSIWALLAADAHERMGKDAKAYYLLACELWPENMSAWHALMLMSRKSGDLGSLLQLYLRALQTLEGCATDYRRLLAAWRVHAFFLYGAWGKPLEAIGMLHEAERAYPEDDLIYDLLARAEETGDNSATLVAWSVRMSEISPPALARSFGEMSAVLFQSDSNAREARAMIQALFDLHAGDPRLRWHLDRMDLGCQRYQDVTERIATCAAAASDERERASWLWQLGSASSRSQDGIAQTQSAYEGVLALYSGHVEAMRGLEYLAMQQKNGDGLVAMQERFLVALKQPTDLLGCVRVALPSLSASGFTLEACDAWLLRQTRRIEDRWYARKRLCAALRQPPNKEGIDAYKTLARLSQHPRVRSTYTRRWLESLVEPSASMIEAHIEGWLQEAVGDTLCSEFLGHVAEAYGWDVWAARAMAQSADTALAPKRKIELQYRAAVLYQDRLKDDGRARDLFARIFAVDPVYRDVFDRLNRLYAAVGLWEQQVHVLQTRLEAGGDDGQRLVWWWALANLHNKLHRAEAERLDYEEILRLAPGDTDAMEGLSRVAEQQGDYVTTAHTLIQMARLQREAVALRHIFMRLGTIYRDHLPNVERAAAAYRRILRMEPDDSEVNEALAKLYMNAARWEDAAQAFEAWIRIEKDPERLREAYMALARCLQNAQQPRKAEDALVRARNIFPTELQIVEALAEHYRNHHEEAALAVHYNRANADFAATIGQYPAKAQVWNDWVSILQSRGRIEWVRHVVGLAHSLGVQVRAAFGAGPSRRPIPLEEIRSLIQADWVAPAPYANHIAHILSIARPVFDALLPLDLKLLASEKLSDGKHPWMRSVEAIQEGLGLEGTRVWVSARAPYVCLPVADDPPQLLVGASLLNSVGSVERKFLIVRALSQAKRGYSAALRSKPDSLSFVVWTVLRAVDAKLTPQGIGLDWDDFELASPRVDKMLTRKQKVALHPWVADLVRQGGLDLARWGTVCADLGTRCAALSTDTPQEIWLALAKISQVSDRPEPDAMAHLIEALPEARRLLMFLLNETTFEKIQMLTA